MHPCLTLPLAGLAILKRPDPLAVRRVITTRASQELGRNEDFERAIFANFESDSDLDATAVWGLWARGARLPLLAGIALAQYNPPTSRSTRLHADH